MRSQGVGLKNLKEAIDTDSSSGRLIFHVFGALAEFEHALIRERTPKRACRQRVREDGKGGDANVSTALNALTPSISTGRRNTP